MFENLKKAQQAGMTPGERRRLFIYLAMLVATAGTFLSIKSCRTLPGRGALPVPVEQATVEGDKRVIDRPRLLAEVSDDASAHQQFQERALEYVRSLQGAGLAVPPEPIGAGALKARPFAEALGVAFEVEGRVTAMTHTQYHSELETLWALVLEAPDGAQVLAVKIAATNEPGAGAPTDAWPVAPVELKAGDRAVVRGIYVQRRSGTVGEIGLAEPTPVLLCSHFRREVEPPADPIEDLTEAAWDKIDDRFFAGTARLDDPAIYEVLQWLRLKGHAWVRQQIDSGAFKVEDWGRDAFDRWSEEAGLRSAEQPRPFTEGARGKLFRTSGMVGKVLLDDWDSLRPNAWGVNQMHGVYLWSDYYGNRVVPCFSPYPWETFGVDDWRKLEERVWVYGVFIKNYTYDTQYAAKAGAGYQKLTMPLFLVFDVRTFPMPRGGGDWVVGAVLLGLFLLASAVAIMLARGEKRSSKALNEKLVGWRKKQRELGIGVPHGLSTPQAAPAPHGLPTPQAAPAPHGAPSPHQVPPEGGPVSGTPPPGGGA